MKCELINRSNEAQRVIDELKNKVVLNEESLKEIERT